MKVKYNFGLLKNTNVLFILNKNNQDIKISGFLKEVKQNKDYYRFIFENKMLDINSEIFLHLVIDYKDNILCFKQIDDNKIISGLFGYTMFDTYGFPIEDSIEILNESGLTLDVMGFESIKRMQKEKQKNTFKKEMVVER